MNESDKNIEPVRGSVITLIIRIIILLVFTDLLYLFVNYFLMKIYFLQIALAFDIHKYVIFILATLHILKSIFQVYFMIKIIMNWLGNSYFITDKQFIKRDGIFNVVEKTYDIGNIRSIIVSQGVIGKLFHFGDVVIETSASGGYKEKIRLTGINEPQKVEYEIHQHT